jgi:hypothetical protein
MKRKIPILLLCLMASACRTSSGVAESSPYHFKWYVDEFWEDSRDRLRYEQVSKIADRHCQAYGKRAVLARSTGEIRWLSYIKYNCIPKEQYFCVDQLWFEDLQKCADDEQRKNKPDSKQIDSKKMSAAEERCLSLGFARATEKFAECVLQLSK